MHRDTINFVAVTPHTDFLITTSVDGHVKLWKKQDIGIEFVKHYRAHLQQVVGISVSSDGTLFASIAEDGMAKVFDVVNFGSLLETSSRAPHPILFRHDQHAETRLHSSRLLLGASQRQSSSFSGNVRHPSN